MKKLLIVTGNLYPRSSANGTCVMEISRCLRQDYDIHYLCSGENNASNPYQDRKDVHTFKTLRFMRKRNESFIEKVKRIIQLRLIETEAPFMSRALYKRILHMIKILDKEYNFEAIISVVHPIEGAWAAADYKIRHREKCLIIYGLDSVTNNSSIWNGWKNFFKQSYCAKEARIYSVANKVILMQYHMQHYYNPIYMELQDKVVQSDIPLFKPTHLRRRDSDKNAYISFLYAGSLDEKIRNPKFLLKTLDFLSTCKQKYQAVFCSRGCEKVLENYAKKNQNIKLIGYINQEELEKQYIEADIMLSIGNSYAEAVPSKLFQYLSTGKPIIHFYSIERDSCLPYLGEYPLCLLVDARSDAQENAKKIVQFINRITTADAKLDMKTINNKYIMNRPEFTADIIVKVVSGFFA